MILHPRFKSWNWIIYLKVMAHSYCRSFWATLYNRTDLYLDPFLCIQTYAIMTPLLNINITRSFISQKWLTSTIIQNSFHSSISTQNIITWICGLYYIYRDFFVLFCCFLSFSFLFFTIKHNSMRSQKGSTQLSTIIPSISVELLLNDNHIKN